MSQLTIRAGNSQLEEGGERIKLPGFGLPIQEMPPYLTASTSRYDPPKKTFLRFPNAIADWCGSSGVTIYERRMLGLMGEISDKPDWHEKVFKEDIVEKWWAEADALNETGVPSATEEGGDALNDGRLRVKVKYMTRDMFDFCMAELRDKAGRFKETGMVAVLDTEATIIKSDSAVSTELRDRLRAAVAPLEDVPERLQDWHPGSDNLVLDLVHPSLWPLVYGKTRVMPQGKVPLDNMYGVAWNSELTEAAPEVMTVNRRGPTGFQDGDTEDVAAWDQFQWLPANVIFREDGTARLDSYVNNLHPVHHRELYGVLEQLVDCAMPLWNEALSGFRDRIRIDAGSGGDEDFEPPPGVKSPEWEKLDDWDDEVDGTDKMDDDNYRDIWNDWMRDVRVLKAPSIKPYKSFDRAAAAAEKAGPADGPIDLAKQFGGSLPGSGEGLQVIFKLASIHLTPEQPEYSGGTWHVEGALNEHICATALYYYDQPNVSPSALSFRQSIGGFELVMRPPQSEHESTEAYYGVKNESGPLIQVLGSVDTRQDRLLVFPNVLQHRVAPFGLADPSRPGHRKILAMFLVDPNVRVLSTANVPPQRRDWWADEVRGVKWFARLPVELFEQIVGWVDDPWGLEEAKMWRERLMEERGRMNDDVNADMMEAHVSFCEH